MEMSKVVAYIRVSSAGQEDGDGMSRQMAAIDSYCQKNGHQIVQVFREIKTGTSDLAERPAMSEMIQYLSDHDDCRTVIIERIDRLARDLVIQEGIIGKFQSLNLSLVSTCEPDLDSMEPSRKFIRQILGAVAELDRSMIQAKLKSGRDRKRAESGRCEGRKPYGHYENEGEVLLCIRTMHGNNETDTTITNWLNDTGIKTRSGGKWVPATVARIRKRTVPA
jgi:DNA invertase Pin-like site-specific DNA recombinase